MSLGERVKDILHGSESDPDHVRPPGSFPTDDMAPNSENTGVSSGTHQRNKLHKPNDPRGKGHGHSDSGVGLESSNEPALTKESVEEAYSPAEGYDERREHAKRSDVAEFDDVKAADHDTTEYNVDPKDLGSTAATATGATMKTMDDNSSPHNQVRTGTNSSTVEHKDPYWGDLPQGQGVYNTVTGHGSSSDEARRQHTADSSTGQGVYNTVAGHGSSLDDTRRQHHAAPSDEHRAFPLVTDRARQHHEEESTPAKLETKKTQEKGSHWKEGAAGVAATGAAGAAGYKATRDDDDRSKSTETGETAEEKEKKGRGGLFGVFHRSSKDDKDKDNEKEHHHKEKEHHHKKHTKEEKISPVAAAGLASSGERRNDENRLQDQSPSGNTRPDKADPALAAAAAAYSQHGDRNTSTTYRDSPANRGTEGEYNALSSGTPSGVRTGDFGAATTRDTARARDIDNRKEPNRNAAVYGTAGAAAALGAGGYAAHEYRKDHNDKDEALAKNTGQESSRSGGWFTAPVTSNNPSADVAQSQRDTHVADEFSKGTGALATAPVSTSTTSRDPVQAQHDTHPIEDFSQRSGGFAAAPMPTRGPATDNGSFTAAASTEQPAMREPSAEIPRATDDANHGKYNTLASGTPSGINLGDNEPKPASTLPTAVDEKSNKGTLATAGLAAAGAGAGAAALASHNDDDKEKGIATEEKKSLQKNNFTSATVPSAASSQKKVTHKCVKCGEENDISQYFEDKAKLRL